MFIPRFLSQKFRLLGYAARLAATGRPQAAWQAMRRRPLGYAALAWRARVPGLCRTIVDVGAHAGDVSAALDLAFRPRALLAIEANPARAADLRARFAGMTQVRVEGVALGEACRTQAFFLHQFDAASSLLPLRRGYLSALGLPDQVRRIDVNVRRLDQVAQEAGLAAIDLLKLDCQGTELQVLHGAGLLLQRVRYIYTEVSFEALYEGGVLFQEMHAFLRSEGFSLVRLETAAGPHGNIDQGDALYRRNGS